MCPAFRKSNLDWGGGSGGNLLGEKMSRGLSSWELFTWHCDALLRFWVSREAERQNCGGEGGGLRESERALSEEHREEISTPLKTGGR